MRIIAPDTPADRRPQGAVSAKRAVTARSERQMDRISLRTSMGWIRGAVAENEDKVCSLCWTQSVQTRTRCG